jgi:hypothetical protein
MGGVRLAGLETRGIAKISNLIEFPSPFLILGLGMLRGLFRIGIVPSGSFLICLPMGVELLWTVVRCTRRNTLYIKIGKGGVSVRSQRQPQGQRLSGPEVKDDGGAFPGRVEGESNQVANGGWTVE